jgi:predicted ATPase
MRVEELEAAQARVETRIGEEVATCAAPFVPEAVALLESIPGVGKWTAQTIVAEIGVDMSRFPSAKHLASWAGVCPGNYESAGKRKRGQPTKGNKSVRTILVEAAWAATHAKGTFLQAKYQRLVNEEAVRHLTTGIELLKTLPDTPERPLQEMTLQTALGTALLVTKGLGAHEVRKTYDRARELCLQLGDTPQPFPTLIGLAGYYLQQEEILLMIELAQQSLALAERQQDIGGILAGHGYLCSAWFFHGHPAQSHEHCEQTMRRYDCEQHRSLAFDYGLDSGVLALAIGAWSLWYLGYPEQARKRCEAAVTLARQVDHPYSLAWALNAASWLHWYRQEGQMAYELADEAIVLATEQDFPHWVAMGFQMRGNALARLGQWAEGMEQLRWGVEAYQATGALAGRDWELTELARGCLNRGQYEEGLHLIQEALDLTREEAKGLRHYEPEKYHAKGELILQQFNVQGSKPVLSGVEGFEDESPQSTFRNPQSEAEACFLKAIEIAQSQKAKSWELRAATSLARLWQQQGKRAEAHKLLSDVYNWFTEGFDTKDLQEAKALLKELA